MTTHHAPRIVTGWMRTSQKEDVEGQIFRLQLELNEIKDKMHNLRIENARSFYRQEFAKIYTNLVNEIYQDSDDKNPAVLKQIALLAIKGLVQAHPNIEDYISLEELTEDFLQ